MTLSVRSMVIPIGDGRLLLPTRLVAKIIKLDMSSTQPLNGPLPIKTYELQGKRHLLIDGDNAQVSPSTRYPVAVLKALSPESSLPPLSLLIAAPPYLIEVNDLDIQSSSAIDTPLPGYEIMLRHHKLIIPDLFRYLKELEQCYGADLSLRP